MAKKNKVNLPIVRSSQTVQLFQYAQYTGPYPPPEMLKKYEEIVPGCVRLKKIGIVQAWRLMMICKRGDVILIRYPNSDLKGFKKRPALVVQGDDVSTNLQQKIVAMITSNQDRAGKTRVAVKKNTPDGQAMKLLSDLVIVADNLATVLEREIDKVIGYCPVMSHIDLALKHTLGLI